MSEILFKIGNSNEYEDGDILAVKPNGYVLTWPQIDTWLSTGNAPVEIISLWPDYLVRQYNRRFRRMQYLRTKSIVDCINTLLLKNGKTVNDLTQKEIEDKTKTIEQEKNICDVDLAKMMQHGIDTSWGWEDLKKHGVLMVDNLYDHDREAILMPDRTDDAKADYIKKRCHKIDYKSLLPTKDIADLKDKEKFKPVDRTKTHTVKNTIISKYGKLQSA